MLTKNTPEIQELLDEIEYRRESGDDNKFLDAAMDLYDKAMANGTQELQDLASCLVGDACALSQDFSYGIGMLTAGIEGVLKAGELKVASRCLNEIGVIYQSQGHYMAAEQAISQAMSVARKGNFPKYEGMACSNFGLLCFEMDDYEHALVYFNRAIECYSRLSDVRSRYQAVIEILSYIVILHIKRNEDIKANAMYREMEAYIEDYHLDEDEFEFKVCRLAFKHYIGDEAAEARYKEESLKEFYEADSYLINYDECIVLFEYLLETKDYETLSAALSHFTSISVCEDLANQYIRLQELYMRMYEETGERDKLLESSYEYVKLLSKKSEEAKKTFAITVKQELDLRETRRTTLMDLAESDVDTLTGLPGRTKLSLAEDKLFTQAKAEGKSFGVEILCIDNYDDLVAAFGLDYVETIIVEAANRLKKLQSNNIFISRYEEGEFVLFFYDMTDSQLLEIATNIHEQTHELAKTFEAGRISVSQGLINAIPLRYNRSWDFLSAADAALDSVQVQCKGDCRLVHNDAEVREEYTRMF